jgi:hypothetical protein
MKPKPPVSPAEVADRAHAIWEKAGRPAGQDLAHWLQAETELAAKAEPARKQPKKAGTAARKTRGRRPSPRA